MTESIGIMLTEVCKNILPFYLSEAETEAYPYAVYEQTTQEFRTKDGVYKITADSYIRIYSDDANQAMAKADLVKAALDSYTGYPFDLGKYVIKHQATTQSCTEGVWQVELQYYVKQSK